MRREYNINTPPPIHKIPFIPPINNKKQTSHIGNMVLNRYFLNQDCCILLGIRKSKNILDIAHSEKEGGISFGWCFLLKYYRFIFQVYIELHL